MENLKLETLDAHLRALEAAFISLARLRLHEGRKEFISEFDSNVETMAKAFTRVGRSNEWKESLLRHRDALKELIS